MRILITLCLLLCAGCASQNALLARKDYQPSQDAFLHGDDREALLKFPSSPEDGDFITSEERTYLSLIQGKTHLEELQKQEHLGQLPNHVPQDYAPFPHEQVWQHLLLGWGYADQGKYADAAAEAHLARDLLTLPPDSGQHFDDPMLRVLLAGLWTMCGQWQEARTDFHAAWILDNSLDWAKEIAAREQAPAQLFIVMGGPGPLVVWDPEQGSNSLRGARKVTFILRGHKSTLSIQDAQGLEIKAHRSPDASPWYAHPLAHESKSTRARRDLAFGGNSLAGGLAASVAFTGATVLDILADTVIGALGGAGVLASIDTSKNHPAFTASDYQTAAAGGAVLGLLYGIVQGLDDGFHTGSDVYNKLTDPANRYRYVRYLPEYLWVGWSDQPLTYPVKLRTPLQMVTVPKATVENGTAVTLAHLADVFESLCKYTSDNGTVTILGHRSPSGNCPPQPDL